VREASVGGGRGLLVSDLKMHKAEMVEGEPVARAAGDRRAWGNQFRTECGRWLHPSRMYSRWRGVTCLLCTRGRAARGLSKR
jgi:hypothetical protein